MTGIVKILFSPARFISAKLLPQARNLLTQLLVPAVNVNDCGLSYGTVLHEHLGVGGLPLPAKLDGLRVTTDGSELLVIGVTGAARVPLPVHLSGMGSERDTWEDTTPGAAVANAIGT